MKTKPPRQDPLDRLLDAAARVPSPTVDETMPPGFAARLWTSPRRGDLGSESLWILWRRLTTGAAVGAAGLAIAVAILPSSAGEPSTDEAKGWEQQIQSWVFEP